VQQIYAYGTYLQDERHFNFEKEKMCKSRAVKCSLYNSYITLPGPTADNVRKTTTNITHGYHYQYARTLIIPAAAVVVR
jgi:hypothetical protein